MIGASKSGMFKADSKVACGRIPESDLVRFVADDLISDTGYGLGVPSTERDMRLSTGDLPC